MIFATRFLGAAALALGLGAVNANAASLTIDTWVDTSTPSSNPILTIDEDASAANTFNLSLEKGVSTSGSVIAIWFYLEYYSDTDLTLSNLALDSGAAPTSGKAEGGGPPNSRPDLLTILDPSDPSGPYTVSNSSGPNTLDWSFAILFTKDDEITGSNNLTFDLADANNALVLDDFARVGLRIQEVAGPGFSGKSDKLIGGPNYTPPPANPPAPPVPLPAAGWMLIAGLGGMAALRRRRKA